MGQSLSPEGFLEQYPLLLESHSVDRDPRHRTRRGPGRATSATNARTVWRAPTPGFGKLTTKWIRGGPRSFAPFAKGPATDSSGWARQSEAGALPLRARQPLRACQPSRGARRRRPHHLTGTSAPTTPENAPALEGDGSDGTAVDPPGPAGARFHSTGARACSRADRASSRLQATRLSLALPRISCIASTAG